MNEDKEYEMLQSMMLTLSTSKNIWLQSDLNDRQTHLIKFLNWFKRKTKN